MRHSIARVRRARVRASLLLLAGMVIVPGWAPAFGADPAAISLHRAIAHPMRYHLALPTRWTLGSEWPVLVVIPDAARDFEANLARFVRARGDRPYILVAPEVLSCGGARSRTRDHYAYTRAEWDSLQGGDDFAFEDAGLAAVLADVHARWRGEPKAFLTGWEAGGHTVWAQALRHPERWRAVAPVTTNYQRRGVDSTTISNAPERARLPIQAFRCGAPTGEFAAFMSVLDRQIELALRDAAEHGFRARPVRVIPNADHGPLAEAVLAWCDSVRGRRGD
jgi:dienelactone hydrolase